MISVYNTAIFNADTKVLDVINDPVFEDYGRLMFPINKEISRDMTLKEAGRIMPRCSFVNPKRTVEIINSLKERAESGAQIFYDIYTNKEKFADSAKKNTGLFFFRGMPNERVAILSAGGGLSYIAAMHDSFPHALELSKKGYNAFALIYRPGVQSACEDLSRAIAFLHENAVELEIDVSDYSLWGGSFGARMTAWLGSYGTIAFGEAAYPRPGAVVLQYTELSEVTGHEPPTYACVGTNDSIVDYRIMENRIQKIRIQGTDARIMIFGGLPHGFGLGEGTAAERWLDEAAAFWEENMK